MASPLEVKFSQTKTRRMIINIVRSVLNAVSASEHTV